AGAVPAENPPALRLGGRSGGTGHRPRRGAPPPPGSLVEAPGVFAPGGLLVSTPYVGGLRPVVPGLGAGLRRSGDWEALSRPAGGLFPDAAPMQHHRAPCRLPAVLWRGGRQNPGQGRAVLPEERPL